MDDIIIGQGQTIRQTVTVEDSGAATATFIATDGGNNIIEEDFPFDGLTADISIIDTIKPVGEYDYYIKIDWDDGSVDYLPDLSNCDGDCAFPQLTICEMPGVS